MGDEIAPQNRPLIVQHIQQPTSPVVVHRLRPLDLGL
jgi:hypothetical protein